MNKKKCCVNCAFYKINRVNQCVSVKDDECNGFTGDGYACIAFSNDNVVVQMMGYNEYETFCECYSPQVEAKEWLNVKRSVLS